MKNITTVNIYIISELSHILNVGEKILVQHVQGNHCSLGNPTVAKRKPELKIQA